jgi:hypothetical protein
MGMIYYLMGMRYYTQQPPPHSQGIILFLQDPYLMGMRYYLMGMRYYLVGLRSSHGNEIPSCGNEIVFSSFLMWIKYYYLIPTKSLFHGNEILSHGNEVPSHGNEIISWE